MGEMRNAYRDLVGKPDGSKQLKDLDLDGKIILLRILNR
jgi:hypothetical protein